MHGVTISRQGMAWIILKNVLWYTPMRAALQNTFCTVASDPGSSKSSSGVLTIAVSSQKRITTWIPSQAADHSAKQGWHIWQCYWRELSRRKLELEKPSTPASACPFHRQKALANTGCIPHSTSFHLFPLAFFLVLKLSLPISPFLKAAITIESGKKNHTQTLSELSTQVAEMSQPRADVSGRASVPHYSWPSLLLGTTDAVSSALSHSWHMVP